MSAETERSSTESSAVSGLDFEDTALTLTLRLPGSSPADPDRKRGASSSSSSRSLADRSSLLAEAPPAPKARVVGWPPVRSFRKNALENVAAGSTRAAAAAPAKFVKVAVDGAPYLRKVNLRDHAGYDQLLRALQDKFRSHFTISEYLSSAPPRLRPLLMLAGFMFCSQLTTCWVWVRREVRQRREEAGGRGERDGVRAHLRGQGRRLDARRRRPLEDVCGGLPTRPPDEELRGREPSTWSCPVRCTAWPLRMVLPERRRGLCSDEEIGTCTAIIFAYRFRSPDALES